MSDVENTYGGDGKAPSLAYFYGDEVKRNADIGKKLDEEKIYRWNSSFWNSQSSNDEEFIAYKWLESNSPSKCGPKLAKELARAALFKAGQLPPMPAGEVVIPLKNGYLHLEKTNAGYRLLAKQPDRALGVTYGINLAMPTVVGEAYVPKDRLEGSKFGAFLDSSMPDLELREIVREYIAYTLTPDTREQVWQCWYGSGSNGKSVMAAIAAALHRKVSALESDDLEGFALEEAVDASLIWIDEGKESGIQSDRFKKLVSGGVVQIDRKYKTKISASINAKWIICMNHHIKTGDASDGFWRRMMPIPWNAKIEKVVKGLDQIIIREELDIVLDWVLGGLLNFANRGCFPPEPQGVRALKDEIRADTDTVVGWAEDYKPILCAESHSCSDIYTSYANWCVDNGHSRPTASNKFWQRLYRMFPGLQETKKQERVNSMERKWFIKLDISGRHADERSPDSPLGFDDPDDIIPHISIYSNAARRH